MKKIKLFSNKYLVYILLVAAGILIGRAVFHPSSKTAAIHDHSEETEQVAVWTCAMHPQIKMSEPGQCPICGMDLIPLSQGGTNSIDPDAIQLSSEAAQLANVATTVVSRQKPVSEVRLYGKVQADERLIQSQVAHIPGRIERLNVNFTGESVVKGQILAEIYSPDLVTAQQELLETSLTKEIQPALYDAAKEKLHQWKLTDDQIEAIETSGTPITTFKVLSNTSGTVTSLNVNTGDYVGRGTSLFTIADLSRVWVMFDAYESDLQYLRKGEKISFTLQALPGKTFTSEIVFVDPVIDPLTRVARVRVETANQSGRFKPEMFATGVVSSTLKEYLNNVVIPRSAVLWTGKRSVVYVKQQGSDEALFKMREIVLGPMLGNSYVVTDGLSEGEEIVTSGTFSVDAAAQLAGKPSMMNPGGGIVSTGHDHGSMQTMTENAGIQNSTESHDMKDVKQPASLRHEMFAVSGNCEMCKERIETAASSVNGVSSATWDTGTKEAHIEFDPGVTTLDAIRKVIAAAGHDNGIYRAPDDVYNSLPECCLYRK